MNSIPIARSMPNLLEESGQSLLNAGEQVSRRTVGFFKRFLDWALQDNILEVAVGLMYVTKLCVNSPPAALCVASRRVLWPHCFSQVSRLLMMRVV